MYKYIFILLIYCSCFVNEKKKLEGCWKVVQRSDPKSLSQELLFRDDEVLCFKDNVVDAKFGFYGLTYAHIAPYFVDKDRLNVFNKAFNGHNKYIITNILPNMMLLVGESGGDSTILQPYDRKYFNDFEEYNFDSIVIKEIVDDGPTGTGIFHYIINIENSRIKQYYVLDNGLIDIRYSREVNCYNSEIPYLINQLNQINLDTISYPMLGSDTPEYRFIFYFSSGDRMKIKLGDLHECSEYYGIIINDIKSILLNGGTR